MLPATRCLIAAFVLAGCTFLFSRTAPRRTSAVDIHASAESLNSSQFQPEALAHISSVMAASADRRPKLEALLRPMYASLQKDGESWGELDMAAVRYVLHRVFVQRHGWHIRGLQPDAFGSTLVTAYLQAGMDELGVANRGVRASELAAVAALLEELTHMEAADKLYDVWVESQDALPGRTEVEQVANAVAITMSHTLDLSAISILVEAAWDGSGDWEATKFFSWLLDVQHTVAHMEQHRTNPFRKAAPALDYATRVVEEVGERHGVWQDLECRSLKNTLVDLDKKGIGRVPLTEFYGAQIWGNVPPPFQFVETEDYLRHLGALDETVRGRPSLLVPNYVNAYSNCILSTDIYSVCCIDECEGLLGKIELAIASPAATPRQIVDVVSALPSDTVVAPRNLSTNLLNKLEAIAALNADGRVPLHSRLFAQWLHHAYPYECAYPHEAAQIEGEEVMLQTADAWLDEERRLTGVMEFGDDIEAVYANALERHTHAVQQSENVGFLKQHELEEMLWSDGDESLFAPRSPRSAREDTGFSVFSALPAALLLASAGFHLYGRLASTIASTMRARGEDKEAMLWSTGKDV